MPGSPIRVADPVHAVKKVPPLIQEPKGSDNSHLFLLRPPLRHSLIQRSGQPTNLTDNRLPVGRDHDGSDPVVGGTLSSRLMSSAWLLVIRGADLTIPSISPSALTASRSARSSASVESGANRRREGRVLSVLNSLLPV